MRVPKAAYEDFVKDVTGVGAVKYQAETSSDVTEEHVDLSARLKNFQAQEVRLRKFFEAAKNVKEMLDIEQELAWVRGEIASFGAQVKSLDRQAAMATVIVELAMPQPLTPTGSWGFGQPIADGLRGAAGLCGGALTSLIATAPVWRLGLILFFPIRAWLRRRRAAAAPPGKTDPASAPATYEPEPAVPESTVSEPTPDEPRPA